MSKELKVKMPITMPKDLKLNLEEMAEEVGLSQNQLVVLAINSLLVNYQKKGSHIFASLLDVKE